MKKIKVLFSAAAAVSMLFSSVCAFGAVSDSTNHWAHNFIVNADAEGWLDVKEDNNFYPDRNATRQEVVYMVYSSQLNRETKLDTTAAQSLDSFIDREEMDDKYITALEALYANGLIKGYEDGSFKPEGDITRAEAATIISQLIGDHQLTVNFYGFNDTLPEWAKTNIERCARAGIIAGYEDNTFRPNSNVTRAELVSMLTKLNEFNASVEQETTSEKLTETTTEETTEATTEETTEETSEETTVVVNEAKAQELLQSINNKRTEESINTLELDDTLNEIAMLRVIEMAEKNIDDYSSPTYGSIEEMLSDMNVRYTSVIEFGVKGVTTGEDVISYLDLSNPTDYDIMMTANYVKAGIGFYQDRWYVFYIKD